jgi:Ca2+-binding RTX toxin-like protein
MRRLLVALLGSLLAAALIVAAQAATTPASTAPAAAAAPGELRALAQSAVFDPATGQVAFTLTFNRPPDFQTVDSLGRQADSFQYYIVGDPSLPYPRNYDSIIRGEELHLSSPVLRVRNARPTDPTAPSSVSGGWGTVRGVVPYQLDGSVLTFSASLGLISDHSVDGQFTYDLGITQYGGSTQIFHALDSIIRPVCQGKAATIIGTNGNEHSPLGGFNDELSGDDHLRGTSAADVIAALDGNDEVSGLGGNDVICSGAGNDSVVAGKGKDTLKGRKGNDKLNGQSGNDTLKGGPGDDRLKGGKGNDKLYGEKGEDALRGGPGKDRLNGGPGRDTAVQ